MAKGHYFRVSFHNQGKVYELYAERIANADLYGFVAIEGLAFSKGPSVVIDPEEERLRTEFKGVRQTLLPMHSIIRIDEVEQLGTARIASLEAVDSNITPFPIPFPNKPKD